jgi:drug/metabolite transporter (DMT)-like permease
MNQQKNNSKLIYALSMLWGFLLISAQFIYFLGSTEGFENALEEMFAYLPVSVAILMLCWISGRSVTKTQINIEFTKRHFILIAILCLFFFPMGLFFLFGKIKYKELER